MKFVLRRAGFYLIAAWVSITLNFFLPRLMPGDPGLALVGRMQGRVQPETIAAIKAAYGVSDEPLIKQYITYIGNLFRGEFGISSYQFPTPVMDVVGQAFQWTLILGLTATILSFLIGTALGVVGAWSRGGLVDSIMPPLLIFIGSFPYFWLASLAIFFLSFEWGWFPLRHAYDDNLSPEWSFNFLQSVGFHLVLPALTIVVVSIGGWVLGMRNAMISTLSEDYVMMAEAKGLKQSRVMFWYAARNALLPNLTAFGMSLGFVLSGALLTEIVFSYPGLGYQLLSAVNSLDYPLMQGLFLMLTFSVLAANLIADIVYVRLDPRVRGN